MPMRIVVNKENRESRPAVFCDYCHKEIINANDGNCLWEINEENEPIDREFIFTHKKCDGAFEKENRVKTGWKAMNLDTFILRLAVNTDMDWKSTAQNAELLSRLPS